MPSGFIPDHQVPFLGFNLRSQASFLTSGFIPDLGFIPKAFVICPHFRGFLIRSVLRFFDLSRIHSPFSQVFVFILEAVFHSLSYLFLVLIPEALLYSWSYLLSIPIPKASRLIWL